jgi:hypothetical protein
MLCETRSVGSETLEVIDVGDSPYSTREVDDSSVVQFTTALVGLAEVTLMFEITGGTPSPGYSAT